MRTGYVWPFKQRFYSLCSGHYHHDPSCPRCQAGSWRSDFVQAIDHFAHERCYRLWFWWHNRPNSKSRRNLRKWFPNLK